MADNVGALIAAVRDVTEREQLRTIQERLVARLLEAERRFSEQSRLSKLHKGDPIDLLFWRRACVQLRAVGDAMAWKFLGYDRPSIVLLGHNQRPGLLVGKAGSAAEWQACNEHWEQGRPCLLTGITNQFTVADLLIADGNTLRVNEVKRGKPKMRPEQRDRMKAIDLALRTSRLETSTGVTYVVKSPVPLASYWTSASSALEEAETHGVSTLVPTEGVAVMFVAPTGPAAFSSTEDINDRFRAVREAAGSLMGATTHRIVVDSSSYPYRPNRAVPLPLLPVSERHAAMLLTGEVVFKVELSVDRLMRELRNQGLSVKIVLDDSDDKLRPGTPVLRWSAGTLKRGIVHAGVVEQVGVELNDVQRWAEAFARAEPPIGKGRVGMYVCQSGEAEVWA